MNKCIDCGKELNNFYAKRCKKCWYKSNKGKYNGNYKIGKYCNNNYCVDCGEKIFVESKRCMKCYGKIISKKLIGRIFTKEHRIKIGLAHKNKLVSLDTRIKLSVSHGGTGIPYEHRKYPHEFYLIRNYILNRDNHICQNCGVIGNTIHHIDYNKQNCKETNLITVCNKCNLQANFNKNYWQNIYQEKIELLVIKPKGNNPKII